MSERVRFDDGQTDEQPADSLDVYHDASTPSATVDEFLERNNLGVGYYKDDTELFQQIERFHDGMFGKAAFTDKLLRRAVAETKREIALAGQQFYDERNMEPVSIEGWRDLDDDERAEKSRREFIEQRGDKVWRRMTEQQRLDALEAVSGIDREWTPPHLRILMAQHELSRSRDARLLDNLFGRVEELITSEDDGGDGGLLGGGS